MAGPVIFSEEWCELVRPWLNADATYREATKGTSMRMFLIVVQCPGGVDRFIEHQWQNGELVKFAAEEKPNPYIEWHTLKFDEWTEFDAEKAFSAPVHGYQRMKNWWGGARGTYHVMCDLHCPSGDPPQPLIPLGMPYPPSKGVTFTTVHNDKKFVALADKLRPAYLDGRFQLDQRGFEADAHMKHLQGHFDGCARANKHFDVQFPDHIPHGGPTFFEVYNHGRKKGEPGPLFFTQAWADEWNIVQNWLPEHQASQMKSRRWGMWWNMCIGRPDGMEAFIEHDWRDGRSVSQIVWAKPAPALDWRLGRWDRRMRAGGATATWHCYCDLLGPVLADYQAGNPKWQSNEHLLEAFSDPRFLFQQSANEGYRNQQWLEGVIDASAWTITHFNHQIPDHIRRGGPTIPEILKEANELAKAKGLVK